MYELESQKTFATFGVRRGTNPVIDELCQAGVQITFSQLSDAGVPGHIRYHSPISGAWPEDTALLITKFKEAIAGNAEKLRRAAKAGYKRRHLFVWVDVGNLPVASVLHEYVEIPQQVPVPELPDAITDIWVGCHHRSKPTRILWRARHAVGWTTIELPVDLEWNESICP